MVEFTKPCFTTVTLTMQFITISQYIMQFTTISQYIMQFTRLLLITQWTITAST